MELKFKENGALAHGSKRDFKDIGRQAVESHRALVLSEMLTPENAKEFIRVTLEGMKKGQRTQYIAYKEMAKLAEAESHIIVEFMHSLGAKSEEEIKRAVQTMQSAEGSTTLDTIARLTEALAQLVDIEPTQRSFVIQRLGGLAPVERMG